MKKYRKRCRKAWKKLEAARKAGLAGADLDNEMCKLLRLGSGTTQLVRQPDLFGDVWEYEVYTDTHRRVPEWYGTTRFIEREDIIE